MSIHAFDDVRSDLRTDADAVVIGSGAGGGVVAKELAEAGRSVVLLEAGPHLTAGDFMETTRYRRAFTRLYYEQGLRSILGNTLIATQQGRCIGGSTTVNSGYCYRTPPEKLARWAADDGLTGWDHDDLVPTFERVERTIGVTPTREGILGRHNRLFRKGAEAMRYAGDVAPRNAPACRGCGQCNYGCPVDAKLGTNLTYVPQALNFGARVYADCRVEEILGVRGRFLRRADDGSWSYGPAATVRAKAVVLAAGAIGTPLMLLKQDLANASDQVGRNLHVHPGCGGVGYFGERVDWYDGVPQGYNVDHFRKQGFLIQNFTLPAGMVAAETPGLGAAWKDAIADVTHYVGLGAMVSETESHGRVRARRDWKPKLSYHLARADIEVFREGLLRSGEILFAAGAERVRMQVRGMEWVHDTDALRKSLGRELRPQDFTLGGNHPQGTARMSADPKRGVVAVSGETHDVPGLWIADASLFPTSIGVNPQVTVMAMATKIAGNVAAAL